MCDTSVAASVSEVLYARRFTGDTVRITSRHCHTQGQLLGAWSGLLSVDSDASRWVVPSTHVVWLPPKVAHGLRSHGPFTGWSLYVEPEWCDRLPQIPCALQNSGLLRELVLRILAWTGEEQKAIGYRLCLVLLDEIRLLKADLLGVALPQEPRLLRIAQRLLVCPEDNQPIAIWAAACDMSLRTFSRRFARETGVTFGQWRRQIRLLCALEKLAAGASVKHVALSLGYDNVSAFISLFHRTLGVTPARYFSSY
ncbi:AraC family transcriptional regulator [Affinibrenneria salicis]|uniref:AraC family transcriptional regulator n=1 Tax=Affinibrenneria salicis TaxID=2590031 RepID=A0A5J5FTD1_9GAMM|nr:helix-turn-helix transcriptional regulator [Affinibrenneria salicis]KAA8996485.1 AraC family transcriptional regulator [Affinibrenneria salicis]